MTRPKAIKECKKPLAIWAITPGGVKLGVRLARGFDKEVHGDTDFFISEKLAKDLDLSKRVHLFQKLSTALSLEFHNYLAHIFIFSTGIAVRMIAPLLKSKLHDPAVLVMDDRGINAISLVSGHIGGANDLAHAVAGIIGARPVITTATDVNLLPSIDMVAKKNNLIIENPEMIKTINMAFLQGESIEIQDSFGLVYPHIPEQSGILRENTPSGTRAAVICSDTITHVPRGTLVLRPPTLSVGIGCNRGTSLEEIQSLLYEVFEEKALCLNSIFTLATTDVKMDEDGILSLGKSLGLSIRFYDRLSLNSVTTIENPSRVVEKYLGVKSVCEAAAILASNRGRLIVPKVKLGNVTLAVARKSTDFLLSEPGLDM